MFSIILSVVLLSVSVAIICYIAYCYFTSPATVTTAPVVVEGQKVGEVVDGTMTSPVPDSAVHGTEVVTVGAPTARPATFLERLTYATKKSATLFVQLATAFFLMIGNGMLLMTDFFNAPEVRDFITKTLTPEVASGVIVFLVLLTTISRIRTMFSSGG